MDNSYGLTYQELLSFNPCERSKTAAIKAFGGISAWSTNAIRIEQAVAAKVPLKDIIWVITRKAQNNPDIARRLHLCLADYAAHVLFIFELRNTSTAPRNAIIKLRAFARNEIALGELKIANAAAFDAAGAAAVTYAAAAAYAAADAAYAAAYADAAYAAAYAAAAAAAAADAADAADAVNVATYATNAANAAYDSAKQKEIIWQSARLIAHFSQNEPSDYALEERRV